MSYNDEVCKICKLVNGYEVEIYDPPEKTKKDEYISSAVRWKSFAFTTEAEVVKFLKERLSGLKPENHDAEYAAGFAEACCKD